jgi:hypothetical protein
MLCIVVAFVKDVYSISWSQFEIRTSLFTLFLVISIFLIFSEYLHFILGRILDHTRDVPGNILERIAIVNLMGGYVIRHPDFDDKHPALFKKDCVHLSFIANDIFLNQIQGALETFLKYPYCLA